MSVLSAQSALQPSSNASIEKAQLVESYGKLPLSFEANHGQADKSVEFISRGSGYGLFLTSDAAVMALNKVVCAGEPTAPAQRPGLEAAQAGCARNTSVVKMRLAGGVLASVNPAGEDQLPGTINYFVGGDPSAWRTGAPTYSRVRYSEVYPGVDLVYYGNQRQLEYDFDVAPYANPKAIRLQFSGVTKLKIDDGGDLIVSAKDGDMAFRKPVIYQEKDGHRDLIEGRFTLGKRHTVGFSLSGYDASRPLVIDPVLAYSTYLGGNGSDGDAAFAIAVDASGDAYVTGQTDSSNFPVTAGSYQQTNEGVADSTYNAFVTKLNSTGTAIVYSTYLGGSGNTKANAIAVDSTGSAYVAGSTFATNFPTTPGAYQTATKANSAGYTAFVTKLNAAGTALEYSTYLGGSGNGNGTGEAANALAVDSSGNAYVAGYTDSASFPVTPGAFQTTNAAVADKGSDAFVTKVNAAGSALVYSTFLGGSGQNDGGDVAYALALGGSGNAYVTGSAGSNNFPTTAGAYQTANPASADSQTAAFVAELNATGTALVYSTYLGGSKDAAGSALAVDASGDVYVAGYTTSLNFPVTAGAYQTTNAASAINASNAFVAKLNPTGTGLVYSTMLGGSGLKISTYNVDGDSANGLAIDGSGNAYVTGVAFSSNFPVTSGALQPTNKGAANKSYDAFVTILDPTGTALVYSSYLGGTGYPFGTMGYYRGDNATGLALDAAGGIYIAGVSYSTNFPVTTGAFQTSNLAVGSSGSNAFIGKLSMASPIATTTTLASSANPATSGNSVTFTANVAAASGSTVPGGSVAFIVDGSTEATVALSAAGAASYSTSSLAAGSHTVTASYGGSASFLASASYSVTETVNEQPASAPALSPAVGTYTTTQSVTLTSATQGAKIYYTTNGTTPTTSSTKYKSAISVSSTEMINAIAVASGYTNSVVASGTYTIKPPAATPAFSVAAGTYTSKQSVTISDVTSGATIYYTTNGTTPTTSSTKYTGAISVNATETIKAIAVATGDSNSAVASAAYTINAPPAVVIPAPTRL